MGDMFYVRVPPPRVFAALALLCRARPLSLSPPSEIAAHSTWPPDPSLRCRPPKAFNQPIGDWDVSSVTNME